MCLFVCVCECACGRRVMMTTCTPSPPCDSAPGVEGHHMPCLMLWMIWKMADPQTTKTKSASSHGPTGDFSSFTGRDVFWTCPRCVMVLLCRSFATFILCTADMIRVCRPGLDRDQEDGEQGGAGNYSRVSGGGGAGEKVPLGRESVPRIGSVL